MEAEKLIETLDVVGTGLCISAVKRDHPILSGYEVPKAKKVNTADPFNDPKYAKAKITHGAVTVLVMWKPSGRLNPIFEVDSNHSPNALYTKGEVVKKIWQWCERNNMIDVKNP